MSGEFAFYLWTVISYAVAKFLQGFFRHPKIRRLLAVRIAQTTRGKKWYWTDNRGWGESLYDTRREAILSAIRGD